MVYLSYHLNKYPKMEIIDIIKLHLQGMLGPAHIVSNKEKVLNNLNYEYKLASNINYNYDLYEEISDKYVRVYVFPYFNKYKDFNKLVDAFIKSSNDENDILTYKETIKKLINDENKEIIEKYLSNDSLLVSHSKTYKDNYHPYYLVINKKYLKDVLC